MPKKVQREEKYFTGSGLPQTHTISVPLSDVEKEVLLEDYNQGSADKSKPQPVLYRWTLGTITAAACGVAFCCIVYVMYLFQSTPVTIETSIVFAPGVILVQKETQFVSPNNAKIKSIPKISQDKGDKCSIMNENKFDCYPGPVSQIVTQEMCTHRGCCFEKVNSNFSHAISVPWCFFPIGYPTYKLKDKMKETNFGFTADLERTTKSPWPEDVMELKLDAYMETKTRFHFKLYDPRNARYEVPIETPKVMKKATDMDYEVKVISDPFGILVTRKSTGTVLFDTQVKAPLIFADQFIQISTKLASPYVYGFGEHKAKFLKNVNWTQLSFWDRDQPPTVGLNLYGDHPFHITLENDGKAHGIFLLNSNAMDVELGPSPAVTYRVIGGILDLYVLIGRTPNDVIQQYLAVIGRPFMPPYWSLGFHLCKYGYGGSANISAVIKRMRAANMPYDTQWNDIDYMRDHLDWTYDKSRYDGLPAIVKDLHDHGQKYIIIVDPGISSDQGTGNYPPYDEGLNKDIFVKNSTGDILIGKVWPGNTAFPDFSHPNAPEWWLQLAAPFHKKIPFDGLWNDMNEPSNFVAGSIYGCTEDKLDKPAYVPGIANEDLISRTVCPSARQHISRHYNLHNMYGHFETISSHNALRNILNKRSIVISRSTFVSTGKYSGHWLGDNSATWTDLYYSIPGMLNFQLFGIPLVGADICGFGGDTTEELCTRWMQLGAFYPFMRNHNSLHQKDQDPAVFSAAAQDAMRKVLRVRYNFLPYLYTLFYRSHVNGTTVARPLFFQYPEDKTTYDIDKQFMWGDAFLISPVLIQGATTVRAYFPRDIWYDIYAHTPVTKTGQYVTLPAPLDTINVHARGGTISPMQDPEVTTTLMRKHPLSILVNPSADKTAKGELYWDDGDQLDAIEKGSYDLIKFTFNDRTVHTYPVHAGYNPEEGVKLGHAIIRNVLEKTTIAKCNGKDVQFKYNAEIKVLDITLNVDILQNNTITWM